ncbi:DNA polymerase III subunit delta' [Thermomonas carbonis]|uniref:DNA-directed DNA polymerase n=1 Tax=Thermomonas carbonis TaxID=1463158 RepID=A0A7G9SUW2_9GAMM|nr:DNA polymerase III subunit delta' [Thermomonas carbonis]QNN71637.1 DNA polymerase III subunit delta' [Thermomonas carbonis]
MLPALSPWQQRAYDHAAAAIDGGHFGHATLITGPALIGKRVLAEHLAHRVLCRSPKADGQACGACKGCSLFAARAQYDPLETRPDGALSHPWGHSAHPDLSMVGYEWKLKPSPPKMRAELVIEQIRSLSEKLSLTPQLGGAQVVIVDPADAINWNAFNALLKTLEEPQPGRYLWLLSSNPARLPATIRSRCQRLDVRLPPRAEALAWLLSRGHAAKAAGEALDAARGHPGLADAWASGDGLALRRTVADDVQALGRGQAAVGEVAQRWVADGRASERLQHLAELALHDAAGLTDSAATRTLAARFDAANRARDLLRSTVRADLAVAESLLAWC